MYRSNSQDNGLTSSDSGNADPLKVMSNSLQLAQTRARKVHFALIQRVANSVCQLIHNFAWVQAEEVVKEYDMYLDGFIEDAVEWARAREPPIRVEIHGELPKEPTQACIRSPLLPPSRSGRVVLRSARSATGLLPPMRALPACLPAEKPHNEA